MEWTLDSACLPPPPRPPPLYAAVRMGDEIQATTRRWLWPGRIPRGAVTVLAGDPGAGKSILTVDLAARVTTGREWPGEGGIEGSRD